MKNMLSENANGSIEILDDYGYSTYTVKNDETGIIQRLTSQLLIYEKLFCTDKLEESLRKYFDVPNDTYAYNLTRVKEAFDVGTMTIEDFEEFDESTISDIAEHLRKEIEYYE